MKIYLNTDRLVLRDFKLADFNDLLALDTDPEVMRYISDCQPQSADAVRGFLDRCMAGTGFWVAVDRASLEFLGWFHFRPDRLLPEAMEVGYRLKRAAWGRGLATEGSMALLDNGIRHLDVTQVTGRTMKGNLASANVLRKCGLTFVEEYQEVRWPGANKTALLFQR